MGMYKKLIQTKKHETPFWDKELEVERNFVNNLKKISDQTKRVEDYRLYNNKKNRHIKMMKKKKKEYYKKLYGNKKKVWKEIKRNKNKQEQGLNEAVVDG